MRGCTHEGGSPGSRGCGCRRQRCALSDSRVCDKEEGMCEPTSGTNLFALWVPGAVYLPIRWTALLFRSQFELCCLLLSFVAHYTCEWQAFVCTPMYTYVCTQYICIGKQHVCATYMKRHMYRMHTRQTHHFLSLSWSVHKGLRDRHLSRQGTCMPQINVVRLWVA